MSTTVTAALAAMQYVAVQTFKNLAAPMVNAEVILAEPFEIYKNAPAVYLYQNGGLNEAEGLGFARQYRGPRIRVEIFAGNYADAEALVENLRSAWLTDYDASSPLSGSVGSGYLKITGGLKQFDIGAFSASEWEKRGLVFRRIADVNIQVKG